MYHVTIMPKQIFKQMCGLDYGYLRIVRYDAINGLISPYQEKAFPLLIMCNKGGIHRDDDKNARNLSIHLQSKSPTVTTPTMDIQFSTTSTN